MSWDPQLLALHAVSDAVIGGAYYSIPLAMATFVLRRKDLAFRWVFWLFVAFILACGSTHFLAILTLWTPAYGLEGAVKAVTAVVSALTAIQLWPLLPKALALPSPAALASANAALREQIARREQAEARLLEAQKMQAVGHLTAGIAHDFNNLLTVVLANIEMLERRLPQDPALTRYVERARAGAARGAALTGQLLAFARRQPLNPRVIAIGDESGALREMLLGIAGPALRVTFDIAPDLWPAFADAQQLETALMNLALNARDAMPSGGALMLDARNARLDARQAEAIDPDLRPGDYVRLSLTDTGTGMSKPVLDAAFEPFFTTKPQGQGTGLGLSQVWGFVKQSQGAIRIETELGRGTTVHIYLRRAQPQDAVAEEFVPPVPLVPPAMRAASA